MFEVGRVFHRDAGVADGGLSIAGYAQPMMAGGIAYGPAKGEQWGVQTRAVDFFDVKGDVESLLWPLQARFERAEHPALHPGRSARVVLNDRAIGWIGELHPRWLQKYDLPTAPVVWELELDAITAIGLPKYREVPRVPAVTRDIALVVRQDVAVQDLVDTFEKTAVGAPWQRYLQGVVLFDEFRPKAATAAIGAQEKSLAFRITLQDTDSTLQDDIVEAATQQLIRAAGDAFGARLRA
jgi:phenylalanyl-tRNA synthetase beta chain